MESRLFATFDPGYEKNKEFASDLQKLLSVTDPQRNAIVEIYPQILQNKTESERKPLIENLEKKTGLTPLVLGDLFQIAGFFLKQFLDDDIKNLDTPKQWVADLVELKIIKKEESGILLSFLNKLNEVVVPKAENLKDNRKFEAGVLPTLSSFGSTVELRGVLSKSYSLGDSVENYDPEIKAIVPIISVKIGLDSGNVKEIAFQVSKEELTLLINGLSAAQKTAHKLAEKVSLPE